MKKNPFTALLPLIPVQLPQSKNVVDNRAGPVDKNPYAWAGKQPKSPKGDRVPEYSLNDRMRPEGDFATMRRGVEKQLDKAYIRSVLSDPANKLKAFQEGMKLAQRKK